MSRNPIVRCSNNAVSRSLCDSRLRTAFFLVASATKLWDCNFSSASVSVFPSVFGEFFSHLIITKTRCSSVHQFSWWRHVGTYIQIYIFASTDVHVWQAAHSKLHVLAVHLGYESLNMLKQSPGRGPGGPAPRSMTLQSKYCQCRRNSNVFSSSDAVRAGAAVVM